MHARKHLLLRVVGMSRRDISSMSASVAFSRSWQFFASNRTISRFCCSVSACKRNVPNVTDDGRSSTNQLIIITYVSVSGIGDQAGRHGKQNQCSFHLRKRPIWRLTSKNARNSSRNTSIYTISDVFVGGRHVADFISSITGSERKMPTEIWSFQGTKFVWSLGYYFDYTHPCITARSHNSHLELSTFASHQTRNSPVQWNNGWKDSVIAKCLCDVWHIADRFISNIWIIREVVITLFFSLIVRIILDQRQ